LNLDSALPDLYVPTRINWRDFVRREFSAVCPVTSTVGDFAMSEEKNPQVFEGSVRKEETKGDFDTRLRRARSKEDAARWDGSAGSQDEAKGTAIRIGTELVVATAVGGVIGYLLDSWLGTKPWLLIVFLFLGNASGLWNVFRLTSNQGYAVGFDRDKRIETDETGHGGSEEE